MQRQRFEATSTAGRKAWQTPRVARLDPGSAESGGGTDEDGDFTAS